MKIALDKLEQVLTQSLAGFFVCSGSELFLVHETGDKIIAAAKTQGFTDIVRHHSDQPLFSEKIQETLLTASFFSPKMSVVIELAQWKIETPLQAVLMKLYERKVAHLCVIFKGPKLETTSRQGQWWQSFGQKNIWIDIAKIPSWQLSHWIQQRAQRLSLQLTDVQAQHIARCTENNVFAAAQVLETIRLLPGPLSTPQLLDLVENSAEYDAFKLIDACLKQATADGLRILHALKKNGVEPLLIIGAWARELRLLRALAYTLEQGLTLKQAAHRLGLWESRLALMQGFIRTHTRHAIEGYLAQLAMLDAVAKGAITGNIWQALLEFCGQLGG